MRRFLVPTTVALAALLLSGCLYVPGQAGFHGSLDYVITPGGTFIFPEIAIEQRGRIVVPPPGGYYRHR